MACVVVNYTLSKIIHSQQELGIFEYVLPPITQVLGILILSAPLLTHGIEIIFLAIILEGIILTLIDNTSGNDVISSALKMLICKSCKNHFF